MCDICTEAVHGVALWTRVTLGLDMCKVCTEAVHGVALWTRVTLGLDMCDICTEAVHCVALWTRVTLSFGHVWHMYRSSPFRSTLNTGYIKLWTCVALDQCKLWTPFTHFCPYFHTPYTLLCPKDEFTFTFRTGLIWKIDNPSTTLSLAPGSFDNPYKGAESAGCQKQPWRCISYQKRWFSTACIKKWWLED